MKIIFKFLFLFYTFFMLTGFRQQIAFWGAQSGGMLTATGATHSEENCTAAGGSVYTGGGFTMCKFTGASCPAGWSQFSNWSATTQNTNSTSWSAVNCTYTLSACRGYVPANVSIGAGSHTTYSGSHSFSNTAIESNSCNAPTGGCTQNYDINGYCTNAYTYERNDLVGYAYCGGSPNVANTYSAVMVRGPVVFTAAELYVSYTGLSATATRTEIGCK